jgi:hypothetical protein
MTDPESGTHRTCTDDEAFDCLADWLRRAPAGVRSVETAVEHPNGTIELSLRHERGRASSTSQRRLAAAIRSAIAQARLAGAE